jgi:hypothetical protein
VTDSTFACPSCSAQLERAYRMTAGVLIRCPHCAVEFKVPRDRTASAGVADLSGRPNLDISQAMAAAQRALVEFILPTVGFGLLALVGGVSVFICLGVVQPSLNQTLGTAVASWAVGFLVNVFVVAPLASGMPYAAARLVRGEHWHFGDYFAGLRNYGQVVLLHVALYVVSLAFLVPFGLLAGLVGVGPFGPPPLQMGQEMVPVLAGASLVGFLVSAYVLLRWSQAGLLILDRGMNAPEALGASWMITDGKVLSLVALGLILGLIAVLGAVACGVGLLVAIPYIILCQGAAYLGLTGQLGRGGRLSSGRDDDAGPGPGDITYAHHSAPPPRRLE